MRIGTRIKDDMNENMLKGWLTFAAIGFVVCLLGWISTGNSLSITNKAVDERDHTIQTVVDDANQKYNDLLSDASQTTDDMVSNFSSVCDELWSGSVQDDCHDNAQSSFNADSHAKNPVDIDNYNDFQYKLNDSGN